MSDLIAFLRAINVGGRQAKNTDLEAAFERMGYADVETFIASGNVIFSAAARASAALERKIEAALEKEFGLEMTTFLRTRADVAAIVDCAPFSPARSRGWKSLYVILAKQRYSPSATQTIEALETKNDRFAVDGREVYWLCRTVSTDSLVTTSALRKAVGPTTSRNITTFRRLAAKYPPR